MGLLTMPFRLPLRPLQGVIKLAEVIKEQAEREMYDPARIRRERIGSSGLRLADSDNHHRRDLDCD